MARYMLDEGAVAIIRQRCPELVAVLDEQDDIDHPENRDWLLEKAREDYCNDEINVDDDAQLSPGDPNGCWVQGWLFIYFEEGLR